MAGAASLPDGLRSGLEVALRAGAAPFVLGLRWLSSDSPPPDLAPARWDARLLAKVALDEFFFATEIASAPFFALRDRTRVVDELRRAHALFRRQQWLEHPERYHRKPPRLARFRLDERKHPLGTYAHLRFESEYEPHPGEPGRTRWIAYRRNRIAHAWLLQHPGPPRPWVLCVPGYRMGARAVDFTGFRTRWIFERLGLNVAIPVMPLHGPRREGRRGGDGFLAGDFVDTIHAQSQAAWDARRLLRWLREGGAPAVAVHGVSLGGYTTALLASLEPRLDCVIAGIPAIDFLRLARALAPAPLLRAAEWMGIRFDRVEEILRVISPLALRPRVPRAARFMYAGIADRVASPDHAQDLWEHWGRPRIAWYEGGHVSFFFERDVKRLIREALTSRGLLPATRPPKAAF